MKPYGRLKKIMGLPYKKDNHHKNGIVNWWETLNTIIPRSTIKQLFKNQIREEQK